MAHADDNPFALRPTAPPVAGRVVRAVALLVVCTAGAYGLHLASERWLVARLSDRLEAHPPHVQLERMAMLSEMGPQGLPALVAAVASEDDSLSSAAAGIVAEMQGRWQTSGGSVRRIGNDALVTAVEQIVRQCPPKRLRRLATLLDPLVLDTVESDEATDQQTYRRASALLGNLLRSPAGSPGPRIARPEPVTPLSRYADDAFYGAGELPPLPTAADDRLAAGEAVVRRVPATSTDPASVSNALRGGPRQSDFPAAEELANPADLASDRGGVNTEGEPTLIEVPQGALQVRQMQGLEYLTDNPLAAYDTRSVIGFVTSVQPHLRKAAEEELRNRGFTNGDMEMAVRMMSPDAQMRLGMVDELASRNDVDPRQWLIWLAADPERDVRLEAVARLGTMEDAEVQSALRTLLNQERDPAVATRLRRYLGLR